MHFSTQIPSFKTIFQTASDIDKMEEAMWDRQDIEDRIKDNFLNQVDQKQSWRVIPKRDLVRLWREFSKYKFVRSESLLYRIAEICLDNLNKIISNSYLMHYDEELGGTFETNEGELQRWNDYVSDPEGHGRYTQSIGNFQAAWSKLIQATTPEETLLAIDYTLNVVHGIGPAARWFVEGGTNTLTEIFEYQGL